MVVAVLLDTCLLPHKGPVNLKVQREFIINIAAEEAQHQVHHWLIDEISSNIGADAPTLVIGSEADVRPVWRIPAYLSLARLGRVGVVGFVDVDVETGLILDPLNCKIAIERAADELVRRLPTRLSRQTMPTQSLPTNVPAAPKLYISKDELVPEENPEEVLHAVFVA
jgi:hypothetical protein